MIKNRLNICYYPTSLILVDDNKKFLQSLRLGLSDYSCFFYENPKEALDFLNNSYKFEPFINRSLLSEEDKHIEQSVAGLNIKKFIMKFIIQIDIKKYLFYSQIILCLM